MIKKIKVGDRIEVFHKPLTREESEGFGTVKKIHSVYIASDHAIVLCNIIFDYEFPNSVYQRKIAIEK